jgi:hypothetical protein
METRFIPLSIAMTFLIAAAAWAVEPWPGESWSEATDLTSVGPAVWSSNLSGAYWNPRTRRLWLADNSGTFTVLRENGKGGFLEERDYSPDADLEAITQVDGDETHAYLLVERANVIQEFDIASGKPRRVWNVTSLVGDLKNEGTEGLAFVPNAWLAASGFADGAGKPYPKSIHGANGLGGIMLVAVQDTAGTSAGCVYAVDLKKDNTWTAVGKYRTSRKESCDLAFDSSVGRLYILHNIDGNILEVTDLTSSSLGSERVFTSLKEFQVPSNSNIEGFALTPAFKSDRKPGDGWCFFTDDSNVNGALRWFKQLRPSGSTNAASPMRDAFQNPPPSPGGAAAM